MSDYMTVFDASIGLPPSITYFAAGVAVALFATIFAWSKKGPLRLAPPVLGVALIGLYAGTIAIPFYQMRNSISSGKCQFVEGIVDNFSAEPKDRKGGRESFNVNGIEFFYSNFDLRPGYHRSVAYGGQPLTGRQVRICMINSEIAQLMVRR